MRHAVAGSSTLTYSQNMEALSGTRKPVNASRWLTRWTSRKTARFVLAAVALDAGQISYTHALVVISAHHVLPSVAWGEPALADLCIVGGTANLVDASRRDVGAKSFPWLSLAGVAVACFVTMWMNVKASTPLAVPVWCVNGWPPVAFGLALESLLSLLRRSSRSRADGELDDDGEADEAPSTRDALAVLLTTGSQRAIASELGVDKNKVQRWAATLRQSGSGEPPAVTAGMNGSNPGDVW